MNSHQKSNKAITIIEFNQQSKQKYSFCIITMRLLLRNIPKFQSSNRKQNFFQLNPIYPDYGQKDFDIYNVERHRVPVFDKYVPIKQRHDKLKLLIREQFLMRKYRLKQVQKQTADADIDEDSGLPIGINTTYDSFIVQYKKNKNRNKKVENEFKALLMRLIEKFKVKSELELIKLFRISLAHSKKRDLKERIRGKLIEEAVAQATASRNDYFSDFFTDQKIKNQDTTPGEMNEQQLEQASFQQALKQIDQKIAKIQSQLNQTDPDWDPIYGKRIDQPTAPNYNYDMNLKRGGRGSKISQQPTNMSNQDEHIRRRINKLFFLRKLQYLKKQTLFDFDVDELPHTLRDKERIINELAHKLKEDEFLIVPDLKDIYNQIDMTLSKVNVRLNSELAAKNVSQGAKHVSQGQQDDPVEQKAISNDSLIWNRLDVEKVFASDYYSDANIKQQHISERQLLHVSPSAGTQLSLNRVPFNLFRHSECEIFNVFTKYRHMIIKDYQKDLTIDPKEDFNYFSLEQATDILKRIKKPPMNEGEKYYGTAKRKSAESEVFVKHGTGRVMVNGEPINQYFADVYHRVEALKPLIFSETAGQYDLEFNVVGGGLHSQSECMAYALAKALMKINPDYRSIFACFALDKHDPRIKEPKRIGLYSARVRPPYVRR